MRPFYLGTKKIVKYILCEIEQHISNNTPLDFESNQFNIEHILPVNADDDWDFFSEAEKSALVYRLGNMTLMNSNQNRDLGNSSYPIKKETYLNSNFHLTRNLANEYNEWTPQSIESWQRYLANQAKTIWRVSQINQLV